MALYHDRLILPWDHEGPSRLEAIDAKTGKTIWSTDRDEPSNWATPRVVEVDGKPLVIHSGERYSRGYSLDKGTEIWRASGLSSRPVSSPVVRGKVGYFASSRNGSALNAIALDSQGDVSGKPLWKIERYTPDCPSLLLSENRLYFISANRGILSCADADNGTLFYQAQRLNGISGVYSSPVAADGKVFITGRDGKTLVIEDASAFKVISENEIGEPVDATLALAGKQIFIRGARHLFCIQSEN